MRVSSTIRTLFWRIYYFFTSFASPPFYFTADEDIKVEVFHLQVTDTAFVLLFCCPVLSLPLLKWKIATFLLISGDSCQEKNIFFVCFFPQLPYNFPDHWFCFVCIFPCSCSSNFEGPFLLTITGLVLLFFPLTLLILFPALIAFGWSSAVLLQMKHEPVGC